MNFIYSGRNNDGGIFSSCNLGIDISEDKLNIPKAESIWGSKFSFPFVFVGDEAFPLRTNLMKFTIEIHMPWKREYLITDCHIVDLLSKIHFGYLHRDLGFFEEELFTCHGREVQIITLNVLKLSGRISETFFKGSGQVPWQIQRVTDVQENSDGTYNII